MDDCKLGEFERQNYLNLETFRKSGLGVQTPVWFVEDAGSLYVRTMDGSGKVKRIRNKGRVRVAPCDVRGCLLGEWSEGHAQLVDEATEEKINKLLSRKYGFQKRLFDALQKFRKEKNATIMINVLSEKNDSVKQM